MNFTAFGVHFQIRTNELAFSSDIIRLLHPMTPVQTLERPDFTYSLEFARDGTRPHIVCRNDRPLATRRSPGALLAALQSDVELALAEHSELAFLHAGVVAWHNRAILLPAASHGGKSTLVNALVEAGATYYSDEYAPIDRLGFVQPYPRPISLRRCPGERATHHLPDRIGHAPRPVAAVIFSPYAPSARWQATPLSRGQAIVELVKHALVVRSHPQRTFEILCGVVDHASLIKSPRGEADITARSILEWIDQQEK